MGSCKFEIYVHLVWATWQRKPMISTAIESELYRVMGVKCVEMGCEPCAIGGTEDHVHVLTTLHPSTALASLVAGIKGSSSHAITHVVAKGSRFQWQRGYAAFSVSPDDVPAVRGYVLDQKRRHALRALEPDLESIDDS